MCYTFVREMVHRGEIIKNAVDESGYSVTSLAKKLHKSRRWMYYIFEKPNVSIDVVIEIGKIIHYDFSQDIKLYSPPSTRDQFANESRVFNSATEESIYWKEMYYELLEKYNVLLEEKHS